MSWNKDKSLALSRICVLLFSICLAAGCIGGPWLFGLLSKAVGANYLDSKRTLFFITAYSSAIFIAAALYLLHCLLNNIRREIVFDICNVKCLRYLSWCCLAAGVIYLLSGFYFALFWVLAVMAVFISLIIRVIKNVFAQAVQLKEENDYTI